jgi:chemotaxis protein histidine kinase CheA
MAEQKGHLDETVAKTSAQGAQEASEPMGENDLAPTVKPEKIKAEVPKGGPAAAAGAQGPGADDETASIVAEQESGPQLKSAAAQAAAQINQEKSQHAAKAAQAKAAAVEEAKAEEAKGKAEQIAEHAAAKAGVSKARKDWTGEQKKLADAAKTEATGAVGEAKTAIQSEKVKAETEAVKHVEAGRKEAEDAKRKGDEEAKREKDKAKQESGGGGFFGWVASKAKALYDKVKDGITAVFNKVRSAITTAINKAKELAHSVIDRAVKFVADKVKAVASKLLAIGDKLIPGFAAARQKFGKWIKDRVKQAVTALNKIVTAVKNGIRKVMTAVGNALKQGLDLLKKGISAAIDAVKNVVKAAIEKAKAAIAALGQFAAIIKDIAGNPGQWLSNLGAAVMDGIKNHLWKALKTAVQTWFNEKLESLLGLGKSVLNLLAKGGINMAQVGKMAFEALKAAIPPALIALLVERLVAMIVPAAGAVMAVVQGLMAAWGAIQKILAAIDRFIAFLKAVKSGSAGPAFANALAAAAVAVIEFVSQFLLRKIAGAARKVAGKIKAIAKKIGKKLMAGLKKVGKKIKRGAAKLKKKIFGDKKSKKDDKKKKEETKEDKQKKLDAAVAKIRPKIMALVQKKASSLRMKAQLLYWRVANKLSRLWVERNGEHIGVKAQVNPIADVVNRVFTPLQLHALLHSIGEKLMNDPSVEAKVAKIKADQAAKIGKPGSKTRRESQSAAAEARALREDPARGKPREGEHIQMGSEVAKERFSRYGVGPSFTQVTIPHTVPGHGRSGHYNPHVADALESIEAAGISPEDIRQGVHNLLQGLPIGPAFKGKKPLASKLAGITRLMFAVEGARNSSALATSYMAFESAGAEGTTLRDVALANNPVSPEGVLERGRFATAEAERQGLVEGVTRDPDEKGLTRGERVQMNAFLETQVAAVVRYLETLMKAEQPMFTDEATCEVFLRTKFKDHLMQKLSAVVL